MNLRVFFSILYFVVINLTKIIDPNSLDEYFNSSVKIVHKLILLKKKSGKDISNV